MKNINVFTWKGIVVSFVFFGLMYYLLVLSPIGLPELERRANGSTILDVQGIGYSAQEAYDVLNNLGPEGRRYEADVIKPLDFLFPLSYGLFYFITLNVLLLHVFANGKMRLVSGIGIIACLLDWTENICVLIMSSRFPEVPMDLAGATSVVSTLKSLVILSCMVLILVLAVYYGAVVAIRRLRTRES